VNAINLAMFTANGYPLIENAVERTHDGVDRENTWPGKMVLGPNNWTNANDPDMPKFGSKPGLKMFALTGTGWSSREISIDANASLVPVAYFAMEVAPAILAKAPIAAAKAETKTAESAKADSTVAAEQPEEKKGGSLGLGALFVLLAGFIARRRIL